MRTDKIADKYNIDKREFEDFLRQNKYKYETGFIYNTVDDSLVEEYVSKYKIHKQNEIQKQQLAAAKKREEEAKKQKALSEMLISSGFNFDGYTITKYSGYISGDDAIEISRGQDGFFSRATSVGDALTASLVKIRRQALKELKEAAYELGCNAIIGVDFDYITLEPETANSSGGTTYLPYVFCVTANGNAVVIEKNSDFGNSHYQSNSSADSVKIIDKDLLND